MTFREAIDRRPLVFDGAMGTQIQRHQLTAAEFGGKDGANDLLTLTRPDLVEDIHARYFAVGCDVVETNTFGSSRLKLDEYGLGHRTYEVNFRAAILARRAAERFATPDHPRFVAGSMGPTGMLPSSSDPALGNITSDALERIFFEQAKGLIEGGVDALIIETQQDMLELRAAVLAADACRKEFLRDVFIIAQPTLIDANGRMLLGTDVASALATLERLPVDAVGLNCSTGPAEMRAAVRTLAEKSSHYVSVLPNAGMPENEDGRAVYKLSPAALADALAGFVAEYGVELVGGCCGTTPEHMRAVVERVRGLRAPRRARPAPAPELSSAMKAVPLAMEPRPLIVGERLNSQGSKKVKELLLADDYAGLLQIARGQVDAGAHVLDVCVALNERDDEGAQMRTLAKLLAQAVDAPLMIDSTEADVVEGALKVYPGRCIVNSVNLEKSGERVRKILPLVRRYGAAVVAMTIDEKGMAQTAERKAEIARRTVAIARDHGIPPDSLVFDALTFTLATGGEEYRKSAIETLEGIRRIKAENPGVLTTLGVSNVSFGLAKSAREVVNSVFLYHAVQAGLDLAIVNPKDIRPYPAIAEEERVLAEDLLLDRRPDALARLIAHFGAKGAPEKAAVDPLAAAGGKSAEERIHLQILHRRPEGIEALIDDALTRRSAVEVLNQVLLPAMKDVGDRFGAGELILPFVLQSAEVMKKAVAHLEQFLEKKEGATKGTVVLATVYGDVHDIGKNLVKTILANNGFTVHDLGKQVPIATVIEKAVAANADAIGLSALLVSTSKQMPFCVEELARRNLSFPVIIGGAAINRRFGYRALFTQGGAPYPGGVFYAKDAFEGLEVVEALVDPARREGLKQGVLQKAIANRDMPASPVPPPAPARRSGVAPALRIPSPPFWGARVVPAGEIALAELWPLLDLPELFKLQWGVKAKGEEYERLIREQFGPKLEELKAEAQANGWLVPKVVYGYFPCHAEGNDLVVLDPTHRKAEVARLVLPRQPDDRNLCMADWFREERGSDVCALQVVTVGDQATHLAEAAQERGDYSRGLFVHGLAVEAAEALAEYWHRRVRAELGVPEGQGKRYSPGYPSWPELADQRQVWKLLEPDRTIGVSLTEANQMVPEASTSAIVLHHPDAIYFVVRGATAAAV
ncbi:methionine synthase [Anaeromyxobacter sp. Fw109-5]|uniref:methionine synthase n=1 Tax=Anaeromyxobacter sp. (strain Fw109-5) TaxID=404589 RepID=UPI0000ED7B81|nr:methionine synthase [Anaeromyxobacter sp. Fw109-5]ABS24307.1 methionine synthase [Anaeromyxobacter sp. Fw109-5]